MLPQTMHNQQGSDQKTRRMIPVNHQAAIPVGNQQLLARQSQQSQIPKRLAWEKSGDGKNSNQRKMIEKRRIVNRRYNTNVAQAAAREALVEGIRREDREPRKGIAIAILFATASTRLAMP